jgi:cytochrome c biogenesis protein CcmG/thiol:disulfide interchange protein DsbE
MTRRRGWAVLAVVVVVVAAVVALRPSSSGRSVGVEVGAPAPKFSTFDLNGRRVRLTDVDGPVLLNFWASWCTPCRTEFPILAQLHGRGVTVLGVVFRDSKDDAAAFMGERHATWPGLVDPKHQIADAYGVRPKPGIPVTFAIDAGGVVRARHLGVLAPKDIITLLDAAGAPRSQ